MDHRKVNINLQKRVIKWFKYIWYDRCGHLFITHVITPRSQGQSMDEDAIVNFLPLKLQAELAIATHLSTLKQVQLFKVARCRVL